MSEPGREWGRCRGRAEGLGACNPTGITSNPLYLSDDSIMANGLAVGIIPSPWSTSDIATPPGSTSDVAQPSYSTVSCLSLLCSVQHSPLLLHSQHHPPCLLHGEHRSPFWPHSWHQSPLWFCQELHFHFWLCGGCFSALGPCLGLCSPLVLHSILELYLGSHTSPHLHKGDHSAPLHYRGCLPSCQLCWGFPSRNPVGLFDWLKGGSVKPVCQMTLSDYKHDHHGLQHPSTTDSHHVHTHQTSHYAPVKGSLDDKY